MTIIETMRQPELFAPWFKGPTWAAWIAFLKAAFALPMTEAERAIYGRHTGRDKPPARPVKEAWLLW